MWPLNYGVSHGDEMCAPLVLYFPHARGLSGFNVLNVASYAYQMSTADDVSEKQILDALRRGSHGKLRPRL